MKSADIVRRAGRNLRQAKGRTFLTSLAIAVGAFTLTASLAVGEGARRYADTIIQSNVDPQSIFVAKDPALFGQGGGPSGGMKEYSTDTTQYGGSSFKSLNSKDLSLIASTPGVESVAPMYLVTAQYYTFEGSDTKYTSDVTAYDSSVRAEAAAGSLPSLRQQLGDKDIVVPETFVTQLGKQPKDMIGKKITLHIVKNTTPPSDAEIQQAFMTGGAAAVEKIASPESKEVTFTVRAVSAKSSTSFTASSALFIAETSAKELAEYATKGTDQYQKYITATVRVKKDYHPETVKASFKTEYQKAGQKDYIIAKTAKDLQGLIFTIVGILQGIVAGFGVIALIASVFGIINTQYISVLERTSQIGLMKALGTRRRDIAKLFRYEAAWIGFIGGILGAGVAYVVGTLLNPWITKTLSLGDGNSLLIFVWWQIVALILSLVLIAILAGWFPSRKAAKLDPIEALRTE